jgi:TatD DNase family protein
MIIDSHAHLDLPEFDADREAVIDRARAAGVEAILCPIEVSSERSRRTILDLTAGRPFISAAAGLHPHQARSFTPAALEGVRRLAADGRIRAVGEIGLDLHYDFSTPAEQAVAFRAQLELAGELRLPAIVHSRLAGALVREAVDAARFGGGGVLHCFTEDWDVARAMLDLGFFISFSGILTFPKAGDLREAAVRVPLDRLLVETDSPYLAPVPHRGKRNEPAHVLETARLLASIRGIALETLAQAVTANYKTLFRLP